MNPDLVKRAKAICDELLACTGALRAAREAAGADIEKEALAGLINRILDVRNEISPPEKLKHTTK
jgi:hypothetical protein